MKQRLFVLIASFLMVASLLAASSTNAYDFTTQNIVKTIGERSHIWPVFNVSQQELADLGIQISITNSQELMPIYRLSDLGKVLNVTIVIPEWNRAPPILYMLRGGPLGHSIANESAIYTQTQVVVYNEALGTLQYMIIDPWGFNSGVANSISYLPK